VPKPQISAPIIDVYDDDVVTDKVYKTQEQLGKNPIKNLIFRKIDACPKN